MKSSPTPGASGHVGIQAVTVSAVPETSAFGFVLGSLGLGFVLSQRRRRK